MITKEKFEAYLGVQRGGLTNMFDTHNVILLSDGILNKEDCLEIMKNYGKYKEEFK